MDNIPNLKYKTTFCLSWAQGLFCEKAEGCYFAHGEQDLRTIEQNRIAVANRITDSHPPENYKTIFCRFYGKGECKLGEACTYAHERREKKIRKANTISYELEHQYALYNYYAQLNPWAHLYPPSFASPQNSLPSEQFHPHQEPASEEMKMSSETASSEQSGSPVQKVGKSSQQCGKLVLMESQEEAGQKYSQDPSRAS